MNLSKSSIVMIYAMYMSACFYPTGATYKKTTFFIEIFLSRLAVNPIIISLRTESKQ